LLHYERAVETKRPAGSRCIEIFSPKIKRRLTLFSRPTHDAWLLLEADPTVRAFCERPAFVDGEAGRVLDFWVDQGTGRAKFLVVSTEEADAKSLPPSVHGVKLQVLRRPDMIAFARRIENWAQIVPYESGPFRVLRGRTVGWLGLLELRMPSLKILPQLAVQDACANLKQCVRAALGPSHLLLLDHALGDDLIDGGFCEPGRDRLVVPVPIGIVGNCRKIGRDVIHELFKSFVERHRGLTFGVDVPR